MYGELLVECRKDFKNKRAFVWRFDLEQLQRHEQKQKILELKLVEAQSCVQ